MAKRRDIVIGIIIVCVFLFAIGFMGLMFIGLLTEDSNLTLTSLGGNIGVVEVFGIIDEPNGRFAIEQLDKWAESNSIDALVVHVDSPGGGVAISQEIYDAINRARLEKPVVVSMASVAASGGYYIACAADRVIANPGTITGSIGVIFQFHTAGELMKKVGIATETVKSGELKDVGDYSRSMTSKEELMLKSVVMDSYEQFVQVVAEGRGMDVEEIYPLADGSIYTGLQAFNLGLVDTLGGLNEAVQIAADLAEMDDEPKLVRSYKTEKITIFDLMNKFTNLLDKAVEKNISGPELMYIYK
jgi:protease-4